MRRLSKKALFDISCDTTWQKGGVSHHEHYFIHRLNPWRDVIPGSFLDSVLDNPTHSASTWHKGPGELIPSFDPDQIKTISADQLDNAIRENGLKSGRFYPLGLVSGLPGVFKGNMTPFRCLDAGDRYYTIDLNHPLSQVPLHLTLKTATSEKGGEERGGGCMDWMDTVLTGPGMQSRYDGSPTCFLDSHSFERKDGKPDTLFYEQDRFVRHIDDLAHDHLVRIYETSLTPGMAVLDLMASWESHLPQAWEFSNLVGIGMNENELKQNRQLNDYRVQDLNADSRLGFEENTFDRVICSLSVEYLIDPVPLFKEAARVLKPGGRLMISFSNRWFPEKVTHVWKELHDFERMGLVLEYFLSAHRFESFTTYSHRGYPRPLTDKYSDQLHQSDPLYVVSGAVK